MLNLPRQLQHMLDKTRHLDFIAPLLLRVYLVPVFWMAGMQKWQHFDSTVDWFANPDYGLGLPFPMVLAFLATWTEIIGAIALALGLALRWISVPLIVTMVVAIFSVHLEFGWQAIADPGAPFATERVMDAADKLAYIKDVVREHADYDYLTSSGSLVILNNGIEFAFTYLIMLVSLFFTGAGRYLSVDYWIRKRWLSETQA
ncbi:MAG: DoxX family protein [Paraglaciecola sp.]|nr:DoxX family protein [Paraglaciecola sp.]NCT49352.1 DoxX family protein [Paraglaciecola sp.]